MRIQHNTSTPRRRWLFLAVPALAALAATTALPRPASAQTTGVFHSQSYLPIIQGVTNPCTGTGFPLTGADHFTSQSTLNSSGVFHLVSHQDAQLTGTDNQGNAYIGNLTDNFVLDGQVGVEQTRSITLPVIGNGAAPNFLAHFTLHFTVNADGTVTALVTELTTTCQG